MSERPLYDVGVRRRAVELYEEGHGRDAIAHLIGAPEDTVREWPDTYRPVGMGALTAMGTGKRKHSHETEVAAARAVADEGATVPEAMAGFGTASTGPLRKCARAYREEGPEAPRPGPKGGRRARRRRPSR